MKAKSIFGFFVAVFALALLIPSVSAASFAFVQYVEVNSVILNEFENFAFSAGEELTLRVVFDSTNFTGVEEDVRVTARILGEPGISDVSERFDVLPNRRYSKTLRLQTPRNIDPNEKFVLEVTVESNSRVGDVFRVNLELQRPNYQIEILSVENEQEVKAGENLGFDIVVKNRGRKESEDTFVEVRIPALHLAKRIFLEDLSAVDQGGNVPDKRDSIFGRVFIKIPETAPAGVYDVEIEAFSDDASALATKRVSVVARGIDSTVVAPSISKTFGVGAEQTYLLTIVNADSKIRVYEIMPESVSGLRISADETVFAIPAGSSKTVKLTVIASREGSFDFTVDVNSDGSLIKKQTFTADVEGKASKVAAGNVAVVLTIVLAVIFVVLLIVLIVLLTRRPEAQEKTQESYY